MSKAKQYRLAGNHTRLVNSTVGRLSEGETVELTEEEAAPMIERGALEPVPADSESEEETEEVSA